MYVRIAALLAAAICGVAHVTRSEAPPPPPPKYDAPHYLNQGWGPDLTRRYYHTSEGTFLMPQAWADALVQLAGKTSFAELVEEYGVLDSPKSDQNPLGLPVGFVIDSRQVHPKDPNSPLPPIQPWLGLTCALCHTGEIRHNGKAVRITGGSSPVDFPELIKSLYGRLLAATDSANPAALAKFKELAKFTPADEPRLADVRLRAGLYLKAIKDGLIPVAYGPYRLDALGLGGVNLFIQQYVPEKDRPAATAAAAPSATGETKAVVPPAPPKPSQAKSPVSYPSVWHGPWRDSVQYAVAIHSPLARNIVQGIGSSFVVGPHEGMELNIDVGNIITIEEWLRDLSPPTWPEAILGAIDRDKAAAGRTLFRQHCVHCHNARTVPATATGLPLIKSVEIPLEKLGTDPTQYDQFKGADIRMTGLRRLSNHVIDSWFLANATSAADRHRATLQKENEWNIRKGYSVPPLDGIWATAPYLHNGSVPTLDDLLKPAKDRPGTFQLSALEYDVKKVGLKSAGKFTFDTSLPGNSNAGHEYPKQPLTIEQREALVEYLKVIRHWRTDGQ